MSDMEDQQEEVVVSSEMVLDDILGDDIIGESSDNEGRKEKKRSQSESKSNTEGARSRSNSYASDISSTASVPGKSKRTKSVKWERLNARYFVIKSNNMDNVELAMEKDVWATPRRNEDMLVEAFRHTKHVILIYSVRESGHFQGLARMMSMPRPNQGEVQWIVGHTPALRMLPNLFKIQWITKTPLDFISTSHLKNRWNEWKPVKISRDGQEIEPKVGAQLCQMWHDCEDPCAMAPSSSSPSEKKQYARSAPDPEENVLPSSVKTTYSSYKDENFIKSRSPERMSDGEEPLAGLSHRMKERLGGSRAREDEEKERKRRRREETRRAERSSDAKPTISKYRMDLMQRNAASAGSGSTSRTHERERSPHRPSHRRAEPSRSHRHSPPPRRRHRSPEKTSAKDILLNGSYLDYVREYQSKHSRLAALLQDPALRQDIFKAAAVAAGSGRSSSRKSRREEEHHLDERSHAALVDEFLSTHSRR